MLSGAKHLLFLIENKQKQILRGVYPELQKQILRFAQDDSEGLRMTSPKSFSAASFAAASGADARFLRLILWHD